MLRSRGIPTRKDPRLERFRKAYRERFGMEAETYAAHAYDGMNLMLWAVNVAGLNRAKIRDLVAYLPHPWPGVTGDIVFSACLDDVATHTSPCSRTARGSTSRARTSGYPRLHRAAGSAEPRHGGRDGAAAGAGHRTGRRRGELTMEAAALARPARWRDAPSARPSAANRAPSPAPVPYRRGPQDPLDFRGPGRDEPEPNVREVVLGWFGPGDPDHVEFGTLWRGATLALEEENAAGGYRGKAFRLEPAWSESPWQAGTAALLRLVYDRRPGRWPAA